MRHDDKDRDPDKARKRAVADARCALRKLGLFERLGDLSEYSAEDHDAHPAAAHGFLLDLLTALGMGEGAQS